MGKMVTRAFGVGEAHGARDVAEQTQREAANRLAAREAELDEAEKARKRAREGRLRGRGLLTYASPDSKATLG